MSVWCHFDYVYILRLKFLDVNQLLYEFPDQVKVNEFSEFFVL